VLSHLTLRSATGVVRSLAILLVALAPGVAGGQGRIAGRIATTIGSSVSGARIALQGTTFVAISDGVGEYAINNVPAGSYTVQTVRPGYQSVVTPVTVNNGETTTLNLVLVQTPASVSMVDANPPLQPVPGDSLQLPVPDSAILRRRQAMKLPFDLRAGQRAVVPLFADATLTLLVLSATTAPGGINATGSILGPDGSVEGSFVVVDRDTTITANIRHGLRLYQIRHQLRGVHLIVEVDQKKLGSSGDDDDAVLLPNANLWSRTARRAPMPGAR